MSVSAALATKNVHEWLLVARSVSLLIGGSKVMYFNLPYGCFLGASKVIYSNLPYETSRLDMTSLNGGRSGAFYVRFHVSS